jgi:hypothetical protein
MVLLKTLNSISAMFSQLPCLGMNLIHQPLHASGEILHGVLRSHMDVALTGQGLKQLIQISHPIPAILVIDPLAPARCGWQAGAAFANQSSAPFVIAHLQSSWIIGLLVQVQHIFHSSSDRLKSTFLGHLQGLLCPDGCTFCSIFIMLTDYLAREPPSRFTEISRRNIFASIFTPQE